MTIDCYGTDLTAVINAQAQTRLTLKGYARDRYLRRHKQRWQRLSPQKPYCPLVYT